ncbi:LLM class flavin-dependent oxidoreductase [Actinomadura rudentiformis]|uniref:LLM class flavin-dependent oxidoreductase n=1 Tax=Actinomadura rudentiformis TaxID=359158 RepID=A0A6H9YUE0_9ACTN|nr:LLM class flavin-dependent oxidoreductase [Actinomadura rudentiformis]KAB2345900.1 LLM class flavin-dependent oxidoreductase [Actinomadura rudentiformis]
MADYGHELVFGTFLTPQNADPHAPVTLARLSEQADLDLVTFQDHPYQPAFLDTWTLLSYVAAQTSKVRLSGNVINLPLRVPAHLARQAASLDLLSGGRFELGLGAGGFWDAIEAMGGPRRTPAEAVDALAEAIDVIRATWDASTRGGVFSSGVHYKVRGGKRGPEPAHDIGIWLGALKPRMLRLIGNKADGWLPSLAYLKPGDLERGNAIIDEAAAQAGRDPREIRRLLNIGPQDATLDTLVPLVIEQGISTFILATDDPGTIQAWGQEIAPALREAVAEERDTPQAVVRGPKALAQRRDGIDYDAVPSALKAHAVEPGDKAYPKVRSTYFRAGSPGLVLRPGTAAEVAEALSYARAQEGPLAVRSGGHGISGRSTNDGGVVIDLGRLNGIDVTGTTVRVGPGTNWGHVAESLAPFGLAMSSGDYGDVGVGGLATAGGIGFLGRKFGLTIDHVRSVDVVLADGRLVRADASENPDLFWALRGAGGNFGIVTSFELEAYHVPDVVFAQMLFDATDAVGLLGRWGKLVEAAPRELTGFLYLSAARRGQPPLARALSVYASDDADAAVAALTPLLSIAPVLQQQAQLVPYAAIVPPADATHHGGQGQPLVSNGFAEHLDEEINEIVADGLRGAAPWIAIRAVGGAVNDVDPAATAYAHRHQNFNVSSVGFDPSRFRKHWDELRPHLDGLYLSFETDTRPERLGDAFPALARLRELKARYDPDNVFNQNFPITSARA